METPGTIHEFWFGTGPDDGVAEAQARLWWSKDAAIDAGIKRRFEPWIRKAAAGELSSWLMEPTGQLALILLCDQFPRNIYRNTATAFAFDPLARGWCSEGLRYGSDRKLRPIERVFFYLPLEHSEALEDQERSVALFGALATGADPARRKTFDGFHDFAIRHRDIVKRFGRFPHRNAILGRTSTPQELAFLATPGSSF